MKITRRATGLLVYVRYLGSMWVYIAYVYFSFQVSVETDPDWNRFGFPEQKLKLQKLSDILVSTVSKTDTLRYFNP